MEISVMPWAQLKKAIKLGTVDFIPASEFNAGSPEENSFVEKYLGSFQSRGQVVVPVTICTVNGKSGGFTEDEWEQLVSAAAALVFATVCPVTIAIVKTNNPSRVPASSDRYLLHREYLAADGVVQLL